MTSVSIIIPSYNSGETLRRLLSSLNKQTSYQSIKEIIIVDSSDDQHTKCLITSLPESKLVVLHLEENRVIPAIQRNEGAKFATGDLLLFLDSDVYLSPLYLQKILLAYNNGNMIGGGSINIPDFQMQKKIVRAQYYLYCNEFMESGKMRMKKLLPAANLFCDRKFFYQTGGFPEIRASEDSLFAMKVSSQKVQYIFLPAAKVFHVFRESKNDFVNTQFLTGKYIFIYRKLFFNPYYLNGLLGLLLIPLIAIFKLLRINYRMFKSGFFHTGEFLKSMPLISIGMISWARGFKEGMVNFKKEGKENQNQRDTIHRWINFTNKPLKNTRDNSLSSFALNNQ